MEFNEEGLKNLGFQWGERMQTRFEEAEEHLSESYNSSSQVSVSDTTSTSSSSSTSWGGYEGGVYESGSETSRDDRSVLISLMESILRSQSVVIPGSLWGRRVGRSGLSLPLLINMLVERGEARVVDMPYVVLRLGEEGKMETTQRQPYLVTQYSGGMVFQSVQFLDVGVKLRVRVRGLGADRYVVRVSGELSQVVGVTPQGFPVSSVRGG